MVAWWTINHVDPPLASAFLAELMLCPEQVRAAVLVGRPAGPGGEPSDLVQRGRL